MMVIESKSPIHKVIATFDLDKPNFYFRASSVRYTASLSLSYPKDSTAAPWCNILIGTLPPAGVDFARNLLVKWTRLSQGFEHRLYLEKHRELRPRSCDWVEVDSTLLFSHVIR